MALKVHLAPAGLMLRDAEPGEMGMAKSDTPGTVLTPCERRCQPALSPGSNSVEQPCVV